MDKVPLFGCRCSTKLSNITSNTLVISLISEENDKRKSYLGLGTMGVHTVNGQFNVLHAAAVCDWCQFDYGMQRHTEIWQFILK